MSGPYSVSTSRRGDTGGPKPEETRFGPRGGILNRSPAPKKTDAQSGRFSVSTSKRGNTGGKKSGGGRMMRGPKGGTYFIGPTGKKIYSKKATTKRKKK